MPLRSAHSLVLATLVLTGCDAPTPSPTAPSPPLLVAPAPASADPTWDPGTGEPQHVAIEVTAQGFVPAEVRLSAGRPGYLELTRRVESECMNAVRMPWTDEAVDLPMNQTVRFQIPDMTPGSFRYACWMNMLFGTVVVAGD